MATQGKLDNLRKIASGFLAIDKEKLIRSTLGIESLKSEFEPKLSKLNEKLEFVLEYAEGVPDNIVEGISQVFDQFRRQMEEQAQRTNAEYVAQRVQFLMNIDSNFENLLKYWPPFVTSAIEIRGFLQDEGIRKEYERTIDAMKEESAVALKLVKEESQKTIEEARKLAQQIEDRARKTAAHISVKEAQDQFKKAQINHRIKVSIWSVLSLSSVIAFILVAKHLIGIKLPEEWTWQVIYYTAIRVTILTTVGAIAAFSLRILRAHMHMSEHNLHRQRIANSMAAFVESAVTPEQRDLILAHLVDAVASFGSSGLLQKEDDSIHSQKMTIDTITRTFTPPPKRS